jgi:hypothetical protein
MTATTSKTKPANTANTFIQDVLGAIWKDRHGVRVGEESACSDLRTAIHGLQVMSGLTAEQLAARLGMPMHRLSRLEKTGGPITTTDIRRMIALATEFSLFKLREYFERVEILNRAKLRHARPPRRE